MGFRDQDEAMQAKIDALLQDREVREERIEQLSEEAQSLRDELAVLNDELEASASSRARVEPRRDPEHGTEPMSLREIMRAKRERSERGEVAGLEERVAEMRSIIEPKRERESAMRRWGPPIAVVLVLVVWIALHLLGDG